MPSPYPECERPGRSETICAANHDILAPRPTSDAILPMQAGPEPARLLPPMIFPVGRFR
jgi:hypothetical protein